MSIKKMSTLKFAALLMAAAMCPQFAAAQDTAQDNEVIKTIMARRSVRKYLDKQVEHDKLAKVVECGINAPNGMNRQPWEVRVVESAQFIKEATDAFTKSNSEMAKRDPNFKNMFRNAPNIICICTPEGKASIDAGLMGGNIVIAAQSMGLGTCCLGGPVQFLKNAPEAKPYLDRLDIPVGYAIAYIIAVGYPDEQPQAKPRDMNKVKFIK